MYCPNCGQQSPSQTLRFCRSCGFRLEGVTELISNNGVPSGLIQMPPVMPPKLRRTGVQTGVKLIFASVVLLPIVGAFSALIEEPIPMFLPLIVFVAGLMRALYARLFEDPVPVTPQTVQIPAAHPPGPVSMLPSMPQPMPPALETPDTSDLSQPPSIIEKTTNLLNRR